MHLDFACPESKDLVLGLWLSGAGPRTPPGVGNLQSPFIGPAYRLICPDGPILQIFVITLDSGPDKLGMLTMGKRKNLKKKTARRSVDERAPTR